jgi:hypothetical protein
MVLESARAYKMFLRSEGGHGLTSLRVFIRKHTGTVQASM